jgi:uncharacterized membrane protein
MKKNKSKLQKSALYFAGASLIASVACIIYLMLNLDILGWENPISASLLASSFFFGFVCFLLVIIGTADIPSFKVDSDSH